MTMEGKRDVTHFAEGLSSIIEDQMHHKIWCTEYVAAFSCNLVWSIGIRWLGDGEGRDFIFSVPLHGHTQQ